MNNLDAAQVLKTLAEHQNTFIKLILIVGTLIYGGIIFGDYRSKDQGVHTSMSQLQDKLAAVKTRDAALKELNGFKSSLPKKINEFDLITMTSNYSKLCHVAIISLAPAESKDMGLYDVINISFSAVADNFKDMMLFFRKIERSDFPLRIDLWSGHEADGGKISFSIQVSAVLIHT
jgi:hypothetical protein